MAKTENLRVRVTIDQRQRAEHLARSKGVNLSEFLRMVVNRAIDPSIQNDENKSAGQTLAGSGAFVGTN
jgi:antitoxin component of RelBE/YafQ-DinJ toxin-antitoxin module